MTFASRQDAGRQLGRHLAERQVEVDVVLGLARGGVIVAAEIGLVLKKPVDAMIVRKIGHPHFREFAVGAMAEADMVLLDESVVSRAAVDRSRLEAVIDEEKQRLREYQRKFERRVDLRGRAVVLADDGLATGATMEAAVLSARKQGAGRVRVAVPVASVNGFERLRGVSDDVIVLQVDPQFEAVGQYYESFPQATDEEVIAALEMVRDPGRAG